MTILAISDVAHGGAAIACRRVADALQRCGHRVVWGTAGGTVWRDGSRQELPKNLAGECIYRLSWRLNMPRSIRERAERWKNGRNLQRLAHVVQPEIVNLHNLHHNLMFGFLDRLPKSVPIAWTLHDMWPLTGYCCHSMDCGKFRSGCRGTCPQMGEWGPAFRTPASEYRRRDAFFRRNAHRLHLVCPSEWMLQKVRERFGKDMRASVVRNCLDLDVFRPVRPKKAVRHALGMPPDARIIVTSAHWADDPLKGKGTLTSAISRLDATSREDLFHVAVGERTGQSADAPHTRFTGLIRDESLMNLYYNAADVMVLPTRVDNLPNTLAESLAAGTPCITSHVGGCPEMVVDGENGCLVAPSDSEALSEAINRVLGMDASSSETVSRACRAQAERMFSPAGVADAYCKIYKALRDADR